MLRPAGKIRELAAGDVLVVGCVRDERLRLPWFLDYHRGLGVNRFLIIDNDSSDGTGEYLRSQSDVSTFFTRDSYAASKCGVSWINEILDNHAKGHWVLVLDADELFVYPDCEMLSLRCLVRHLDNKRATAMMAPLLDMYSKSAINEVAYSAGESFLAACPYFDGAVNESVNPGADGLHATFRGGPRDRLFWKGRDRDHPSPFLRKIPLVKWQVGMAFEASTHVLNGARIAEATGLLLHFKFLQDFAERAEIEANRKEHWEGGRQYAAYSERLSSEPTLSAYYEGSVRYEGSQQLVRLGFMKMPGSYPRTSGYESNGC